jgi:hypothetical protein
MNRSARIRAKVTTTRVGMRAEEARRFEIVVMWRRTEQAD